MPLPNDVHVDTALTAFSKRYSPGGMIADRVFPPIPVKKESDEYFIYDQANLRPENDGPRSAKDPAAVVEYDVSTGTYQIKFYSLKDLVTDREKNNADSPLTPGEDAAAGLMDRMLIGKEQRAAAMAFSSTYMTSGVTLSGTDQWSDDSGSDPLGDIETAKASVHTASRKPDEELTILLGMSVWRVLRYHGSVTEAFKYTSGGGVTMPQLAQLLGIKPANLIIGVSGYNSADEGQSDSLADIWGKHCLVGYINPAPRPRSITLGGTWVIKGGILVTAWRNNDPAGEWKKVEMNYHQNVICADCGYLITDVIA